MNGETLNDNSSQKPKKKREEIIHTVHRNGYARKEGSNILGFLLFINHFYHHSTFDIRHDELLHISKVKLKQNKESFVCVCICL